MKVVIFQPMMKLYRVPLFESLHSLLSEAGYELRVVCGAPWKAELERNDNVILDKDYCFFEKSYWFYYNKIHFLPGAFRHILWADIVITEQANKHIHNYILILLHLFKLRAFAYWGHGQNRQGNPTSFREMIKRALICKTDWWFSYTSGVADYLTAYGFPKERITVLNNSIDTTAFRQQLLTIGDDEIADFNRRHKIPVDARIGLFCGSIYAEKKLEFMLESALLAHRHNPSFVLLIGGAGKELNIIKKYAEEHDFIIYLGGLRGKEKALAFKRAEVFICPGAIGLAILDAFSAGLPVFTTNNTKHGPEIEYLRNNYNGGICDAEINLYTDMVVSTLASFEINNQLSKNAVATALEFSIENMAHNFSVGIQSFGSQLNR